jgi:Tfp pilus assembly protein FimT
MRSGFTLVEAMVIIAVIGIITAISLPRFDVPLTTRLRVENEARRIQSDLRLARRLAITNNDDYILRAYASSNEYKIFKGSVATGNQVGETRVVPWQIAVSGDNRFTFESLGNAASTSGTSLSLTSGSYQYDITITIATGRVSIAEVP